MTSQEFPADEPSRHGDQSPTRTGLRDSDDDQDALRLAGVRSNNPFANADNESNGQPMSAIAADTDHPPGDDVSHGTDSFDHDHTESKVESGSDIAPDAKLDTWTSNISRKHGGTGSEIGHNVDKNRICFADRDKIDLAQGQSRTPNYDEIDKASTRQDEDRHGDSDGILGKFKVFCHSTKEMFHPHHMKVTSPIPGFNPTSVHLRGRFGDDSEGADNEVGIIWRSRDNRKGRNSIVVPRASMAYPNVPPKNRPVYSSSFKGVGRNLYRMAFTFPYWDMAFWSGWAYTWGSVLFVIDGVWAWGPVGWDVEWAGIGEYGIGVLFFIGALLYELGATMSYLEAVNDGSFHGSAMKRFLEGHQDDQKRMLDEKMSNFFGHLNPLRERKRHAEQEAEEKRLQTIDPEAGWKTIHRHDRRGSIYSGTKGPVPRRGGVDHGEAEEGESHEYLTWRWWPTWYALTTHHIYEIGYIACSVQLFGATLFCWCGLVSLPHFEVNWTDADWYGAYWMPEVLGSCCFLSASVMFLLETQEKWWKPELGVMGWWIGLWAKIGSWGFLLNGLFGVVAQARPELEWAEYASECCTTWGSFGYLCSGICQWYEAVNKHPVEELLNESGDMKSSEVHPI